MNDYWKDATVRVGSTFAGGMVAVVGTTGANLFDWRVWAGGALAGVLSVLRLAAVAGRNRIRS